MSGRQAVIPAVVLFALFLVWPRGGTEGAPRGAEPVQKGVVVKSVVQCDSTEGGFYVLPRLDWAPHGAQRFIDLVDSGFFTNMTMFRVPPLGSNPIAQFGTSATPAYRNYLNAHSEISGQIRDDPDTELMGRYRQLKGHFGYGGSGENSRTYHMWVARAEFQTISKGLGGSIWDISVAETLPAGAVVKVVADVATPLTQARAVIFGRQPHPAASEGFTDVGPDFLDTVPQVGDMKPWGDGPDTGKMMADPTFSDPGTFPGTYLTEGYPKVGWFKWCRRVQAHVREAPPATS
eukprot:TRINITY_DN20141_c0_g1_i1.p1 TRINITY_DN20141_c0_g1~~TRINITY_DN20141_c0_g1_i1.p1  ORF type:complete len:291 (+),score=88.78 TRINITY_DN20141_c0_g1_i1:101-973(+)